MPVGDSNLLLPGDPIFVVGYPGIAGSTVTFTSGIMSGWLGEDLQAGGDWLYRDSSANPGAQFSIPNPQPGRWYIDVFNALGPGQTGHYNISVR